MNTVIIVNGKPRAGKDSTVEAMTNILTGAGIQVEAFSSIDPVRLMLTRAGFNLEAKTPEDRALLAEVGDAVEKHSEWRSRSCISLIRRFFGGLPDGKDGVLFLHVREPAIINRITESVKLWSPVLKVIVRSPREENVTSNAADMGVEDMKYDAVINNNGTLDDLARMCDRFLFLHQIIQQLSLLHR